MIRILLCVVLAAGILVGPASAQDEAEKTKIVLVAGNPSHAPGEHEHRAGAMLLAKCLNESDMNLEAVVTHYGWPREPGVFDGADAIVMYCDGGKGHMANPHLGFISNLAAQGVGLVHIHYAVETITGDPGNAFLDWIGGFFEINWSVNPHWDAEFETLPDHPITNGVPPFTIRDEWYYHMRFRENMEGVTPILTAMPPKISLSRDDGPHSGNPHVRKAVLVDKEPQHVAWAYERPNGGRGFGFTGGHFHKNWHDDNFRKLMLNAICWTAKMDIPENGVESDTPTKAEMEENLDKKGRATWEFKE
jgi:type 1 glutamine amidotransferase